MDVCTCECLQFSSAIMQLMSCIYPVQAVSQLGLFLPVKSASEGASTGDWAAWAPVWVTTISYHSAAAASYGTSHTAFRSADLARDTVLS